MTDDVVPHGPIPLEDLRETWETLTETIEMYATGSDGERTLIEARRLIEVEMHEEHGDEGDRAIAELHQ